MNYTKCLVSSCNSSSHRDSHGRRGFCSTHYQRNLKYGDPEKLKESVIMKWFDEHSKYLIDECLTYPFCVDKKDGYGRVHPPKSNITTASNFMLRLSAGKPPTDKHECAHTCGNGNKACVNPLHLYWATPRQNQHDRIKHGTTNRGIRQWNCKITESDVLEIRKLLKTQSQTSIAKTYNVTSSAICNIKSGKNWSWLNY